MLKSLTYELTQNLRHLSELVARTPCIVAVAYPIPSVMAGFDNEPVLNVPVTPVHGKQAVREAVKCWNDLYINETYSKKCARRTAGFIQYAKDSFEIADSVNKVNFVKDKIRLHVTSLPKDVRFQVLRNSLGGVMTLHLYRKIGLLNDDTVAQLNFSWGRKDIVHTADPNKLADTIGSIAKDNLSLSELSERVRACPASALRVGRRMKPQIYGNTLTSNLTPRSFPAAMPLIVLQDETIQHVALNDYDSSNVRQTRSDKRKSRLLGVFRGQNIFELLPRS